MAIATASFYTEGDKRFGKFFLISDKENLKHWQVTPESIPRRIRTFIGMPFVSEPGLAHFGADNMTLDAILTTQEKFRAGTIVDVQYNENTSESFAIVEFLDNELGNKTWEDLQKGEAIYVSPAVAGSGRNLNGVQLFLDWAGIHLARVSSPAYGVFHASIKASCEGSERECIRNLLASASHFISSNDSFNIEGFSSCKNMQTSTTQTTSTATTETPEAKIASLETKLASLQTAYEAISKDKNGENPTGNPSTQGQTTPVTDPIVDPQNRSVGSADTKTELASIKAKLANYEKKAVASLIEQMVDMKASAGMYATATEMEEDKKKFANATEEEMDKEIASISPFVQKMASMNERFGVINNSANRVIAQVASASTDNSKVTSLADLRKVLPEVID